MDPTPTAFDPHLQSELERLHRSGGLALALRGLHRHQVASGFIRDELKEVQRFEFTSPDEAPAYFSVQFNPARARRFAGRGLDQPPAGAISTHGGCFLCPNNIAWQQQGAEKGYRIGLGQNAFVIWMNPFPLASGHAIVATEEHLPQHWDPVDQPIGQLVDELTELACQVPGWISFYNGVGAGASIEGHRHFHVMPRTSGLKPLPIELAAERFSGAQDTGRGPARVTGHYPIDFVHWRGPAQVVQAGARQWLCGWQERHADNHDATANLMACYASNREQLDLYFVPRVRSRSRAEGFSGVIGSFEAMGEIICSTEQERIQIESGQVDYRRIHQLLATVSVKV